METAMAQATRVEAMYAKYGPTIYARCRRLLKNQVVAEDATQDVFMKVLKHIASAPSEEAVLPWIHRITTNHCLNVLRDSKRHAEPVEHVPDMIDDEFEDLVMARNFANHVLDSAPELLRTPAMLYHGRGMDQSKVAATLGVSRRTVLYRLAAFSREAMKLNEAANA
jgi:RNA polymerase sigma-70 factor (ECF subfamily)